MNWAITSLFIILRKCPTLNQSIYQRPHFIKVAMFSDVILVSNYHGCKREALNGIQHILIDFYKTVKPSHLEKLKIIQNIISIMFQVNFIFSNCILIKLVLVFSTPLSMGETDFQKILLGVLSG